MVPNDLLAIAMPPAPALAPGQAAASVKVAQDTGFAALLDQASASRLAALPDAIQIPAASSASTSAAGLMAPTDATSQIAATTESNSADSSSAGSSSAAAALTDSSSQTASSTATSTADSSASSTTSASSTSSATASSSATQASAKHAKASGSSSATDSSSGSTTRAAASTSSASETSASRAATKAADKAATQAAATQVAATQAAASQIAANQAAAQVAAAQAIGQSQAARQAQSPAVKAPAAVASVSIKASIAIAGTARLGPPPKPSAQPQASKAQATAQASADEARTAPPLVAQATSVAEGSPGVAALARAAVKAAAAANRPDLKGGGPGKELAGLPQEAQPSSQAPAPSGSGPGSGPGQGPPLLAGAEKGSITLVHAMDGTKAGSQTASSGPNLQKLSLDDLVVKHISSNPQQEPGSGPEPNSMAAASVANPAVAQGPTAGAPPAGTVPLRQTLLDQVQEAASSGTPSIKLVLHPEALGTVHLHVQIVDGAVSAVIKVDHPEVGKAISQQLDSLRQSFQTQGIKIDKLEVNVSGDQSGQDASTMMNFAGGAFNQQQPDAQAGHARYFQGSAAAPEDEASPGLEGPVASVSIPSGSSLDLHA